MNISSINLYNSNAYPTVKKSPQANVNFGLANAGKLKTLFSYGLPCMYSGVEMIDPRKIQGYLNKGVFNRSSKEALDILQRYEKQITSPPQNEDEKNIEAQVYRMIKRLSKTYPELTLQQILNLKVPQYKKLIRTEQDPVIEELKSMAEILPDDTKYKFAHFMAETDDKLNDKPIELPFSSYEFKYKLNKIKEDVQKNKNRTNLRVVNKMIDETSRLSNITNEKTIPHQKVIISYIEKLQAKSELKDNVALNELFTESKARLNQEKIKVPFKRKSFIYDLQNLLKPIQDNDLKEKFLQTACKLPTSSNSLFACVLKFASEPSDKIAYRLLWPNFASVEHILPKSKGGADDMSNYGGATTKENSLRQSIDFTEQLKRRPRTGEFSQNYINRLIEYLHKGIFKSNNISPVYIDDFKSSVETQAKGQVKLVISDMETINKERKNGAIYNLLKTLSMIGSNPERSK